MAKKYNRQEIRWHRLDNTANLFPVITNSNYSNMYRISMRLKSDINPILLQSALDTTLPRFGSFKVRLRHGFFWYYFESNDKPCLVSEEMSKPCAYFPRSHNNHYLFRVSYYKSRINLEVYHVLTDGAGAVNFLRELVCRYLDLVAADESDSAIPVKPAVDVFSDIEDSYNKNFTGQNPVGYNAASAYRIRGEKMPIYTTGVIHGYVSIKEIIAYCRERNMTITQYLVANVLWCIYKANLNGQPSKKPISVSVPVNLRPYFDSTSTMNFFSIVPIIFHPSSTEHTFEEILKMVQDQFEKSLTREYFESKIAYNVSFGKKWYLRILPLFIKNIGLKYTYVRSSHANTITLSNIGRIKLPDEYKDRVESAELVMGATNVEALKFAVCSYERSLIITVTSQLQDTYLQKAFFRKLSSDGLKVQIETNGANYEIL